MSLSLATGTADGIVSVSPGGGAFAVLLENTGDTALNLTLSTDTGAVVLPLTTAMCRIDPGSGTCVESPAPTSAVALGPGDQAVFAVFVSATCDIALDPTNRLFVRAVDPAQPGASTSASVQVRTTDGPFPCTAPVITITTPSDNALFVQNQLVPADYSCAPSPSGAPILSCVGLVPPGGAIDTGAVGPHFFTVEAEDANGVRASRTHTYRVADAFGLILTTATQLGNGIADVPLPGTGFFVAALEHTGDTALNVTISTDTGTIALPLAVTICRTDPGTGVCLPAPTSTVALDPGGVPTFAFFVTATCDITLDPDHRIFVRATYPDPSDPGHLVSTSGSVQVQTVRTNGVPDCAPPPTPAERLAGLMTKVTDFGLDVNVGKKLEGILADAEKDLAKGKTDKTCKTLSHFVKTVGKEASITPTQATELIDGANDIRVALGCT